MTYLEAISALQQRGFDAVKVAQATQVASLQTAFDCAAAVSAPRLANSFVPPLVSDLTALMTTFTFALLEQQVAYAKAVTETLATPVETAPASRHKFRLALVGSSEAATGSVTSPHALPQIESNVFPIIESDAAAAIGSASWPGAESESRPAIAAESLVAIEPPAALPEPAPSAAAEFELALDPAPEAPANRQLVSSTKVPTVSGEFSAAEAPAEDAAGTKMKAAPAASARASAKPPKAPPGSNQRPIKRGPPSK